MSSVSPLWFLFSRSLVNGVKRAVTSPKRLIALVAVGFYYWQLILGRLAGGPRNVPMPMGGPRLALPPAEVVDAGVFGLVGAMSLLLMTSVLGYKGGFKAADVDVLFPTPVSPKVVLLFRIVRDTLATLLLPLFIGVIGYRSTAPFLGPIFRNYPKEGGDILRAFSLAYLLVSLVWVCVGYAASLFVNRSDFQSDRNRKWINAGIAAIILGLAAYLTIRLRLDFSAKTLLDVAHTPGVRLVLAPVTLATWAVMGAYQGHTVAAIAGFLGLFGLVALALRVAITQVGWMYDQAAVRGFDSGQNLRALQKKGDVMGMQAERARQGKLKHGRIARKVASLRVRGPMALLWKEAILQARGSLSGMFAIGFVLLFATGMMMFAMSSSPAGALGAGWALMAMQGMVVYTLCLATAQSGFIEFLRRVDVQKPLPFTPAVTVFWETVAKAVAPTFLVALCGVVGVALAPGAWVHALAGVVMAPAVAIMLTAVVLLITVLFPDFDDPTQRGFRGLMLMLGIAIVLLPGAGLLFGAVALHVSPLVASLPIAAVDLGIAAGLSTISGGLYAGYNPSE